MGPLRGKAKWEAGSEVMGTATLKRLMLVSWDSSL